jgi:fucose permease
MIQTKKQMTYAFLLLAIIYVSFIALGLPDALLGSAWNLVRIDLNVPLGTLGLMTVVVYIMSIISTYNAPRLLRLFQTKWITFVSIAFTGVALILLSQVTAFYQMLFFALPLGMGAGAIDVSLNHYLAKNYKASHMSYLHSFYGVGVTAGPSIMAYTLNLNSWRMGYIIVGSILLVIALMVFVSFKLWHEESVVEKEQHEHIPLRVAFKIKGALNSMFIFLFYVHIESLLGVWIASYIFIEKGVTAPVAALFATTYYLGLTIGRLLSGFLSKLLTPHQLIYIGIGLIFTGAIFLLFNVQFEAFYFVVVGLLGLGSGPIYPTMMFTNNSHFEPKELSKIISLQMVIGYMGFGIMTPLAGLLFDRTSIAFYPYVLIFSSSVLVLLTVRFIRLKTLQKQSV